MRTHRKEDHPNAWAQPNDTVHHKDGWAACWMCEVERLRKVVDQNGRDFQHERDKRRAVEAEAERLRADRDLMFGKFLRVVDENERLRAELDRETLARVDLQGEVEQLRAKLDSAPYWPEPEHLDDARQDYWPGLR